MHKQRQSFSQVLKYRFNHLLTSRRMTNVFITATFLLLFNSLSLQANQYEAKQNKMPLSLEQAIKRAQQNDPWLQGSLYRQHSMEALSAAAISLPDTKFSVGVANLPFDSFAFDQEPMTQFRVGVQQAFPRGDTLALRQKQLSLRSAQHPFQRAKQRAEVAVVVSKLWLDAFAAEESIRITLENRELFDYLVDIATSNLASGLKQTRQQDLIRARLELTHLDDRLIVLQQRHDVAVFKLWQWLQTAIPQVADNLASIDAQHDRMRLLNHLPHIELKHAELLQNALPLSAQTLWPYVADHPSIRSIEQKIIASRVNIDLAKQKFMPQWGVNASYSYRNQDSRGHNAADLVSLGVTFDLPIFTHKRHDHELQSAISDNDAIETEKWSLVRNMLAALEAARGRLIHLSKRQHLYESRLLKETHSQAEAALIAYTHGDAEFAEVMRARIARLNVQIDAVAIVIERMKTIVQLNYFFIGSNAMENNIQLGGDHE